MKRLGKQILLLFLVFAAVVIPPRMCNFQSRTGIEKLTTREVATYVRERAKEKKATVDAGADRSGIAGLFRRIAKAPVVDVRETVQRISFGSPNSLNAWDEKLLASKGTEYSLASYDGKDCVNAVSEDSASALYYKERLSYRKAPFISWDWKAEKFPARSKKEMLDSKKEFDFAAQVYVVFYSRFLLNAKAIQYVWAEEMPQGFTAESPYTKNVKIMVLESGASDVWRHEERDLLKDFQDLFGQKPEKDVMAISFMTDSDSTESSAVAYFSDFTLGYLKSETEAATDDDDDALRDSDGKIRGTVIEPKKKERPIGKEEPSNT